MASFLKFSLLSITIAEPLTAALITIFGFVCNSFKADLSEGVRLSVSKRDCL